MFSVETFINYITYAVIETATQIATACNEHFTITEYNAVVQHADFTKNFEYFRITLEKGIITFHDDFGMIGLYDISNGVLYVYKNTDTTFIVDYCRKHYSIADDYITYCRCDYLQTYYTKRIAALNAHVSIYEYMRRKTNMKFCAACGFDTKYEKTPIAAACNNLFFSETKI